MASTDRDLLIALIGGGEWDHWDTEADLSDWYGVKVSDQGRVVELDLSSCNLRGMSTATLRTFICSPLNCLIALGNSLAKLHSSTKMQVMQQVGGNS